MVLIFPTFDSYGIVSFRHIVFITSHISPCKLSQLYLISLLFIPSCPAAFRFSFLFCVLFLQWSVPVLHFSHWYLACILPYFHNIVCLRRILSILFFIRIFCYFSVCLLQGCILISCLYTYTSL